MSYESEKARVAAERAAREEAAKKTTSTSAIPKEVTPTATAAPTSAPTKGDDTKTVTELEEAKKTTDKKEKEDSKKSDKKGDGKMSETEKTAKMVAPMGYAAKARALLDCMYATCRQFEREVAEMETLEGILVSSEDELGNAEHVWKYRDRNGAPCFARTMGEVLKLSGGGKPEETWAFCVRGKFLELTREQKEMFGLT